MNQRQTIQLYKHVIDNVLNDVRHDLEEEGLDDVVIEDKLKSFRTIWEHNLLRLGGIPSLDETQAESNGDSKIKDKKPKQRSKPLASSSSSSSTSGAHDDQRYAHSKRDAATLHHVTATPLDTSLFSESATPITLSRTYADESTRTFIPQTDGGSGAKKGATRPTKRAKTDTTQREASKQDEDDDGDDDDQEDDQDDSELGSDDDDPEEEPFECKDLVLCQYETVKRVNNKKFKCKFKDGIISIDKKEYVFAKLDGNFAWE